MKFSLKPLPYSGKSLEPIISGRTLEFHYEKHHKGYLNKLNDLIGDKYAGDIENVIRESYQKDVPVFNNAAQVYNHSFYWESMTPHHRPPSDKLTSLIKECFGSLEAFEEQFVKCGISQFGSGWVWLVKCPQKGLEILKSSNADNPLICNKKPLLTCDVWEHAYYLDYQNLRPDYIQKFLKHLINWEFVEKNLV